MRITKLVTAVALAALPATQLQAQYFSAFAGPTQSGSPFWDQTSQDNGVACNIGYVLTGQTNKTDCLNYKMRAGYVAPFTPVPALGSWYAHANANINASVGFAFIAGNSGATLTYWGGVAGANPLQTLFARDLSTNTILHTFDITNSASWTWTSAANAVFDLGIARYNPAGNSYSWSGVSPNQFAAFGNGVTYGGGADCGSVGCWVGAEDVRYPRPVSDYDYQDGVLNVTGAGITTVPEPSSVFLMASGLIGLATVSRRRRKSTN